MGVGSMLIPLDLFLGHALISPPAVCYFHRPIQLTSGVMFTRDLLA